MIAQMQQALAYIMTAQTLWAEVSPAIVAQPDACNVCHVIC